MQRAIRSASLEIIVSYCFARHYNTLDVPDFKHPILLAFEQSFPFCLTLKHFPYLFDVLTFVDRLVSWFNPPVAGDAFAAMNRQIDELLANPLVMESDEHETIYNHLMAPHPVKGQHTTPSRKSLVEEAINLLAAGSFTVGNAAMVGIYYVLNDPVVHKTLVQELRDAWPNKDDRLPLAQLEKLPYLVRPALPSIGILYSLYRHVDCRDQGILASVSRSCAPLAKDCWTSGYPDRGRLCPSRGSSIDLLNLSPPLIYNL